MIFFDNASTTKIYKEVAEFICNYSQDKFFNPSGIYKPSVEVLKDLTNARNELLSMLGAKDTHKVLFTASATEANNYAIRCFVKKNQKVLVSEGEHSSIYECANYLRNNGFEVEFVKLTSDGTTDLNDLKQKLTSDVGLVSVIHASNETGAVNNVKEISNLIKSTCPNAIFHVDGVQAFCKIPVSLANLGVDLYTLSSHKVHGPRGVGALIINNKLTPKPLILGGGQENGLRSGTENTANILGFIMAAKIMQQNLSNNTTHIEKLKQTLLNEIKDLPFVLNGNIKNSLPNILSISFGGVRGEVLVHMLEEDEVYVSTGSSCNSKHTGNRVLLSMGKSKTEEMGNIRISFSEENTLDEVYQFAKILSKNITKFKELGIWKK